LEYAADKLARLGEQLDETAHRIQGTPGRIPATAWAGETRDAICAEMTGLGLLTGAADEAQRDRAHAQARSEAETARTQTLHRLDADYQALVDVLREKFRQAGHALATATLLNVPDSTVDGYTKAASDSLANAMSNYKDPLEIQH
jgi:hypothetical protein